MQIRTWQQHSIRLDTETDLDVTKQWSTRMKVIRKRSGMKPPWRKTNRDGCLALPLTILGEFTQSIYGYTDLLDDELSTQIVAPEADAA